MILFTPLHEKDEMRGEKDSFLRRLLAPPVFPLAAIGLRIHGREYLGSRYQITRSCISRSLMPVVRCHIVGNLLIFRPYVFFNNEVLNGPVIAWSHFNDFSVGILVGIVFPRCDNLFRIRALSRSITLKSQ